MTFEELYKTLTNVNALRKSRLQNAEIVLNDLSLFPKLIDIVYMTDDKTSIHAAWVFEYVCAENIYVIIPHLDNFTTNIHKLRFDSAIRPIAKVCEFIAKEYVSKQYDTMKKMLTNKYKQRIIEACFDWMINDQKVAVKAYAMNTLFLLGKGSNWVYPALVEILERDYQSQSAGFKARARHVLKKIQAKK
jgi:hypothetical protein